MLWQSSRAHPIPHLALCFYTEPWASWSGTPLFRRISARKQGNRSSPESKRNYKAQGDDILWNSGEDSWSTAAFLFCTGCRSWCRKTVTHKDKFSYQTFQKFFTSVPPPQRWLEVFQKKAISVRFLKQKGSQVPTQGKELTGGYLHLNPSFATKQQAALFLRASLSSSMEWKWQ